MKSNISFYTHDADSHNHWKFKTLRRKYDWAGEGKFWALNNMIAKSPNCLLDISSTNKKKAVAAELEFTLSKLDEFIYFLAEDCELVTIKDGIISTDRTQEDLKRVTRKREGDREHKSLKDAPFVLNAKEVSLPKVENPEDENLKKAPEMPTNGVVSVAKTQLSVAKSELSYYENEQIRLDKINTVNSNKNIVTSLTESSSSAKNGAFAPPQQKKEDKEKDLLVKQQACIQRREKFKNDLRDRKEEYPPDMINAFYTYWSELNKSKTKMRWEMQQTWELGLRLAKWEQNNQKFGQFNANGNDKKSTASGEKSNTNGKKLTGVDIITERLKQNLQFYAAGSGGDSEG